MLSGDSLRKQANINKLKMKYRSTENKTSKLFNEYEEPILDSDQLNLQNNEERAIRAKSFDAKSHSIFFEPEALTNHQNSTLLKSQTNQSIIEVGTGFKKLQENDPVVDERDIYKSSKRPNLFKSVANSLNYIGEKQIFQKRQNQLKQKLRAET